MQLAPGPIPALAPDLSALAPEKAQFADIVNESLADLPQLDDDLGAMVDELALFDAPPEFDVIDQNLNTSDEALIELEGYSTSVHIDVADNAIQQAQGNFALVSAEAPAEVWSAVPVSQGGPSGSQAHPGENGPTTIAIDNTTRPGDTQFYSGDSFRITIQISSLNGNYDFANKPLSLTRSLNGVDEPPLDIGSTDQFGRAVYNSSFNDASVGDRTFGVDPPGFGTTPLLTLSVLAGPAPGGPTGAALGATLNNLSTGDASIFHVLNVWSETITGPANQPVYLDQVKDGVDQGELFVGSTDQNGSLTIGGTISQSALGSYTETFRVGSVNVPTQISFTVVP